MTQQEATKRTSVLAVLALALLPLVWLWPAIFGSRCFISYDIDLFPPASITASDSELAQARQDANLDVTELPIWFVPELEMASKELREGRLPTWNPNARAGAPLHAHGLIGLCYPPNWIALFADEPASKLGFIAWCNLALAGLLAFGLFRQLGFAVAPAWLAAAIFEMSGPSAANSFFWMRLASFVWLPGVLWPMLRIAQANCIKPMATLALGFAFAMTWLAGFPPFAATTTFFAGLLFLWLTGERVITRGPGQAVRLAACLLAGLVLGACWAMPQVLPSLAFFPESARLPKPLWSDISGQAFEPYGLLGYLMSNAFGDPTTSGILPYGNSPMQLLLNTRSYETGKAALPNYNFTEYSVFVSSFGAVLAVIGAFMASGRRAWFVRFALLMALGLGLFWPGWQLLYHLPIVQNVWPIRWPTAGTLFVAWLIAFGYERLWVAKSRALVTAGAASLIVAVALWSATAQPAKWHQADPEWAVQSLMEHYESDRDGVVNHVQGNPPVPYDRFARGFEQFEKSGANGAAWLAGIGLLLLVAGLGKHTKAKQTALIVAAIASLVQLTLHGTPITKGTPSTKGKDSEIHEFLRAKATERASVGGFQIVRTSHSPRLPDQLPPGQLMLAGIRDLNFYSHADSKTLVPVRALLNRNYSTDIGTVIAGKGFLTKTIPAALLQHPYFDLIGVRYALTTDELTDPADLRGAGPVVGPVIKGRGALYVHERASAVERAYVAQSVAPLADDAAVVAAITANTLVPRRQAYVVAAELPESAPTTSFVDELRALKVVRDDPCHIVIDVAPGDATHLVMIDTFLPGWSATIDGKTTEIVRCNHSQRMITIPKSACQVVITYEAPGLILGFLVMIFATLLAIAAWFLVPRKAQPVEPTP